MPVRRTAFITVAIMAIIACGFGSARAAAAATQGGQAAARPAVLLGGHCVTVHSNVHSRSGTICVYVARQSGKVGGQVAFTTHSGRMQRVSAQILRLSKGNVIIQTLRNPSKAVTGPGTVAIPMNWWGEPPLVPFRMSAFNACMTWTDGSKACTGASWLSSQSVSA